jgi:hypothetical protein
MPFTLRIDSILDLGDETCITGRLIEGAYSGPREIRLTGTTGERRTAAILRHSIIGLLGWPIKPGHYTHLDLYIATPSPPFSIDTDSLVEGVVGVPPHDEEGQFPWLPGGARGEGMPDGQFEGLFQDWKKRAEALDRKIRPLAAQEVDMSDPDWEQKLRTAEQPADELGLRTEIESLFDEIIERLELLDGNQRQLVFNFLNGCSSLMWSAVISGNLQTRDGFRKHMLLFVIKDQGKDTRDAILELSHYREVGKALGIDVDAVFKELAPLASDLNKYGMGSTRDLLLRS